MKRRDLIRRIENGGCVLIRHGARHDWYQNPKTGVCQPVPRHREIKEPFGQAHHQNAGKLKEYSEVYIINDKITKSSVGLQDLTPAPLGPENINNRGLVPRRMMSKLCL